MATRVNTTVNLNLTGGPSFSVSEVFDTEAYDKISITVEAGTSDKEVDLQPSSSGQVQMLFIKASKYDETLSYKVHDTSGNPIPLDRPQLFFGKGAVSLLGDHIDKIFITNNLQDSVDIEVLVCRDATV